MRQALRAANQLEHRRQAWLDGVLRSLLTESSTLMVSEIEEKLGSETLTMSA